MRDRAVDGEEASGQRLDVWMREKSAGCGDISDDLGGVERVDAVGICVFLVFQSGVGDRSEENLEIAKPDVKIPGERDGQGGGRHRSQICSGSGERLLGCRSGVLVS